MEPSHKDWGFEAHAAVAPSVRYHFNRLVAQFEGREMGDHLRVNGFSGNRSPEVSRT